MKKTSSAAEGARTDRPLTSAACRWLLPAFVGSVIWTVVLLAVVAAKTDGLSRIVAGLGGLVAIVVSVLGLFAPLRRPSIPRQSFKSLIILVVSADALATVGWPVWAYYQANTAKNVTAQAELKDNLGLRPGMSATFQSGIAASRKSMVVTVEAVDHNSNIGDCASETTLSVTSGSADRSIPAIQAVPGTPTKIRLIPGQREITLTLTVENSRDPNCAVDLALSEVTLTNQ